MYGYWVILDVIKLKWSHIRFRWAFLQYDQCPGRRDQCEQRQSHTRRMPCDGGSSDWSGMTERQGVLRMHSYHQKLQRRLRRTWPRVEEGARGMALLTIWFGFQNKERINFCHFKSPILWYFHYNSPRTLVHFPKSQS